MQHTKDLLCLELHSLHIDSGIVICEGAAIGSLTGGDAGGAIDISGNLSGHLKEQTQIRGAFAAKRVGMA